MNSSSPLETKQEFLIYTEETENPSEPTEEEIKEYAKRIGINVEKEPNLLYLAKEGINHKLPEPWKPCLNKTRDVVFYLNEETKESQWEHPMDPVYRDRVIQARAELALTKIQSFDPLTKRPPNKDLPPIKRSGGNLAPINPSSSLGKLGGFGSAARDLRQSNPRPNTAYTNDFLNNSVSNNNNGSLVRSNSGDNSNIISGSSLNSFKDTDDDESSPSLLVRPQPQRRIGGLTITGGGANFLKGTNQDAPTKGVGGSRLGSLSTAKRDRETLKETGSGDGGADKKPIKSILVNSISRSRPKNPTDNIYELDGFSMNLDEMTDEEKMVYSQIDTSTASKSKANVKFNLDENTELKFEMDDEDDEMIPDEADTDKTEDDEESASNQSNVQREQVQSQQPSHHNGSGDSLDLQPEQRFSRQSSLEKDSNVARGYRGSEVHFVPEYSEEDIAAMKKAMHDEMEAELTKFKDQLESERKKRQEQIQKHLEETVTQFKLEKDETLKRIRKDMDSEKMFEIDKAKREIENLLQKEIEEMKVKFDETLQRRREELEQKHLQKIEELTSEFRKKEEEKVKEVLSRKTSDESIKQVDEDFKKQKDSLREEHKKHIMQMKDYHNTILERIKADLEAEEEKIRQDHSRKRAEMIATFEQETEELKKKLVKSQEEALRKIKDEFEVSKAALEKSLKASLQEVADKIQERSASETNLHEKAADEELQSLKIKYQQLEGKYRSMRMELQQLTQEMSPSKKGSLPSSTCSNVKIKKKSEPTSLSARSERKTTKILNSSKSARNESFEGSDTNHDSAHGSESNTDTNSSHYPSSDGLGSHNPLKLKESDSVDEEGENESASQSNRINAALKALEVLKQEILDLKRGKTKKLHHHQEPPESGRKTPKTVVNIQKTDSPRKSGNSHESTKKKSSEGTPTKKSSKSARAKVLSFSPPTHDTSTDYVASSPPPHHPKFISRSVSVIPQDLSGPKSDPTSEDAHQRIVEDAKAFIRMQKNRLKDPSPIPNSTHLIHPTTKNNLLLFDEKMLKSVSPRRPTSIHMDLVSETESSGVSSLKDQRSSERKKLSKDIDEICNSLNNLDHQMKLVWSVVKEKQQMQQQQLQPYLIQDESLSFLNASSPSDFTLLPNTVPMILGKSSSRICASLPSSARKPLVPPPTPNNAVGGSTALNLINSDVEASLTAGPRYSSLLSNSQTSSSQTVLDALRMSGLSTTRLDCTDLLKSLEDELKEFKTTKQKLLEKGPSGANSISRHINSSSNILEKTKDLQEWLKKY